MYVNTYEPFTKTLSGQQVCKSTTGHTRSYIHAQTVLGKHMNMHTQQIQACMSTPGHTTELHTYANYYGKARAQAVDTDMHACMSTPD